jgi:uncharacterized iron-regulated protein
MQTGGIVRRLLALAAMLVLSIGQAQAQKPAANAFGFSWQETGLRDHPLVGRAWSAAGASFLDPVPLSATLARADFLLLGEVYDNADAHALQGWAISRRAETQGKFGVVFEHIRIDQQEALARLDEFDRTARRVATANDLFRFLDWQNGGWPSETKFSGLFNAVFNPRLPIYPANPPRQQVRAVARGEDSALPAQERARILLDAAWDKPLADALFDELKGSHCGAMPESAVPAMIVAQRYRDAVFADVMLTAAKDHGAAVLAAGNGHVRTDRAVPWYLRQRAPGKNIIAVMMLEVEDGKADPAGYAPLAADGKPAVDFIVFTPRAERPDPCEGLRQRSQPKQ